MSYSFSKKISDDFAFSHSINEEYFYCPLHTHDTIELYFFISGCCDYLVEGSTYHLLPGDILIMRPVEAHCTKVLSVDIPYERIVFDVSISYINNLFKNSEITDRICNLPLGTNNLFRDADFGHNLCKEMLYQLKDMSPNISDNDIISRITYIINEANIVLKHKNSKTPTDSTDKLIDYVNKNLFSDITLEQVSNEFFISKSQINRIFKKKTGSSLYQYVLAKRLITAKNMISSGESMVNACEKCGFSDYSSFYRSYIKRFGHSPKQDKKQQP